MTIHYVDGSDVSASASSFDTGMTLGIAAREEFDRRDPMKRIATALEDIAATLRAMHSEPDGEPVKVKHEWAWPSTFFGGGMFG